MKRSLADFGLETKSITVYSVIKRFSIFYEGGKPKNSIKLHSTQPTKLIDFHFVFFHSLEWKESKCIITVFTVSTETSIKLGEVMAVN